MFTFEPHRKRGLNTLREACRNEYAHVLPSPVVSMCSPDLLEGIFTKTEQYTSLVNGDVLTIQDPLMYLVACLKAQDPSKVFFATNSDALYTIAYEYQELYLKRSDLINNLRTFTPSDLLDRDLFIKMNDMKKFDTILQNPPYSHRVVDDEATDGKLVNLWKNIISISLSNSLKPDGVMTAVHPRGWRSTSPMNKLWDDLTQHRQMRYLEMHSAIDGQATFGACTSYDWYVLQNTPARGPTEVLDQDKKTYHIDLRDWSWLPNTQLNLIKSFLAKKDEPKVIIIADSTYHHQARQKDGTMSRVQTGDYIFPCVYYVNKDGQGLNLWYSSVDRGHFGVPKVIVANADVIGGFVDLDGAFGLTEFPFGIVDIPENLPLINQAISSKSFIDLCEAFRVNKNRYNWRIISLFRKDFWKEFI